MSISQKLQFLMKRKMQLLHFLHAFVGCCKGGQKLVFGREPLHTGFPVKLQYRKLQKEAEKGKEDGIISSKLTWQVEAHGRSRVSWTVGNFHPQVLKNYIIDSNIY